MEDLNTTTPSRFSIPDFDREEKNVSTEADQDQKPNTDFKIPEEDLERTGFFCAVNNPKDPKASFQELLKEHKEERKDIWENIKTGHTHKIEQYKGQIAKYQELLDEAKQNLTINTQESKETKQKKLELLRKEIEDLEIEIKSLSEKLAEKKENGIDVRIQKVREELRGLVTTLEEISQKRDQINDDNYSRDKEILKRNADFWDTLSQKYEDTLEALKGKSLILFKNGITPKVAHFFTFTGVSATILAGWLFAIFSSIRNIDDEDWLFFILESLHSFGNQLQLNNTLPDWKWILLFLSFFLLLLIVITTIGWVCKKLFSIWIVRKKKDDFNNDQRHEPLLEDKGIIEPNFLVLWLQWAPYIFIASIVYVVIQIGTDLTKLKALDISLSGQAVGSGLALIIGGLGFVYITNIIIPRFKENQEEHSGNSLKSGFRFLGKSFELLLLLLIFLVTFTIMYLNKENGAGALIGFVTVSLISGYLLGTGLRFKGLLDTKRYLENRFINYKLRSHQLSRPLRSRLDELENGVFTKGFLALEKELLELLVLKTRQLNPDKQKFIDKRYSIVVGEISTENPSSDKNKKSIFKPIKNLMNRLKSKDDTTSHPAYAQITEQEKLMFPIETEKIGSKVSAREELKREFNQTSTDLENMNEEKWDYQKEVKAHTSRILELINHCKSKIGRALREHGAQLQNHQQENIRQDIALQNGFDLGKWFLKYGTGRNDKS